MNLRKVDIWDFGRLNFVYTLLSKRKLQWFVDNGHVGGWDDPRFPTVRGIRRRGMTIETIQEFILAQGPSQQIINMEWDNIWTINKRNIDPVVPRYTALDKDGAVKVTVKGAAKRHTKELPRHKKNPDLGNKITVFDEVVYVEQTDARSFAQGEEVTFMDWGNVIIDTKETDAAGNVLSIEATANLDGDFKKTKKKVTWLAPSTAEQSLVEVDLLDFDYLITKKKLEEEDNFADFVTPNSDFRTVALADHNVASLNEGVAIQFERKGYYILDKKVGKDGKAEFIRIPDGKQPLQPPKLHLTPILKRKKRPLRQREPKRQLRRPRRNKKRQLKSKRKALEKGDGVAYVAGAVGAGCRRNSRSGHAIGARKEEQKEKAEEKEKEGEGEGSKHFPEIIDTGKGKINMYEAPVITTNIDTPVETKMYAMKRIL